ncbi:MAG TPA: YsnF/AvaK domain-containing protein [Ktedonobacterales bacterium]|jgi:uncharacterized protein (TIGR02271 family)|nr:YsnF/AvaK domain-containing protein [Ktedonobacterales bacterium]
MDSYSEAPNDLVVHGEVITPGALVEANDGPVGRVERIIGPHNERHGPTSTGSFLVQTPEGQTLDIAADAVSHVVPNQPAPTVYLRVSRAFLGLSSLEEAPQSSMPSPATDTAMAAPAPGMTTTGETERERVEGEDVTVPLSEERLTASTEWRERGRAHIHKRVAYENQRLVVPLNYEEVVVEHLSPESFDADAPRAEDELIIPIVEERLVVRKETFVREYVRVRKQMTVKQYQVRGQVRREVVQVDESPDPQFGDQAASLVRESTPDARSTDSPTTPAL